MKFSSPLESVTLLRRYKRFLGDVRFDDGRELTVHTPNTGSMLGCAEPNSRIWIRNTGNAKRKYLYAWDVSETHEGTMIGVNTGIVNALVSEAIENGVVSELQGYETIRSEVLYGQEKSRIDLLLEAAGCPPCYVEIKNVTARAGEHAIFPDAVTERGRKHLRELIYMKQQGYRAVIFFCIQRGDVARFRAATEIDSAYAETLQEAVEAGVEALAYMADITPHEIVLAKSLPVDCPG